MILADEPTKGLDQSRIQSVVDAFHQLEDRTLLCVTHDLRLAKSLADSIVVMYASQQIESGPGADFFAHPLHPYSRAMLEALPDWTDESAFEKWFEIDAFGSNIVTVYRRIETKSQY